VNRSAKKHPTPYSVGDFTLFQPKEKKASARKLQNPDEVLAMFKSNFVIVEKKR